MPQNRHGKFDILFSCIALIGFKHYFIIIGATIVLKTGSGQPIRPVQLGTGHSPGLIFTKDLIALLMRSTPVEPVDFLSNR